jgi:sialate O-acetylesterase
MDKRFLLAISGLLLTACDGGQPDLVEARSSALIGLTVAPIFGAHMVLQRGTAVPVFGTATPGSTVEVQFQGQDVSVVADAGGQWLANLAPMPASAAPGAMTISSAAGSIALADVQVGEVWLCSGQSNMGKSLSYADGSAPYIADAPNHNIRLFRMTANNGPATTTWQISNSTTAAAFSAVGYWAGLDLSQDLGVPIGLVQATLDGSDIAEWEHSNGGTGDAYDAMVAPIQPFVVKGVLWYQGESNGGDAGYQTKLTAMIAEWRGAWGSTLPFGIVQLPASKWSTAKIAQLNVSQSVANTFLVVTSDLPGGNQLHPTVKYPVGIRSSIGARGAVYAEPIEYSGPLAAPTSFVSGNTVTVQFTHVGNGLATTGGAPSTFEVAAVTGQYVSATATLVGNTIQVRANRVSAPKRVRYGFSSGGNLINQVSVPTEGGAKTVTSLPASLFQVDLP